MTESNFSIQIPLLLLSLSLSLSFCDIDIEMVDISQIIKLEILPNASSIADGSSSTTLKVSIPEDAVKGKRTIMFTTTAGTFANNKMKELELEAELIDTVNEKRYVETVLIAPTSKGNAIIKVKILDSVIEDSISFSRAIPTRINLKNDVPAISSNFFTDFPKEVFLEATVSSEKGLATSGTKVSFDVFENNPNDNSKLKITDKVRFRNEQRSTNGIGKVSGFLSVGNLENIPESIKVVFSLDENPDIRDSVFLEVF